MGATGSVSLHDSTHNEWEIELKALLKSSSKMKKLFEEISGCKDSAGKTHGPLRYMSKMNVTDYHQAQKGKGGMFDISLV